jgi:tRNA U34 5-methylaminomethyl-2-thiouridine-forming methyltransferase MnmC
MEKVLTNDGSYTYFSKEFQEHYHCMKGACSEAEIKHVGPARDYFKEEMLILDYCFGLGYNALAALVEAKKKGIKKLRIVCLENDLNIINEISQLTLPEEYNEFQELFQNKIVEEKTTISKDNYEIIILVGDARETIKEGKTYGEFDVVFFDPFSPKKCPELWTQDIFAELFECMKNKSILTTYSCATHVRKKLKNAGFEVKDGPIYGRKSPATVGIKY